MTQSYKLNTRYEWFFHAMVWFSIDVFSRFFSGFLKFLSTLFCVAFLSIFPSQFNWKCFAEFRGSAQNLYLWCIDCKAWCLYTVIASAGVSQYHKTCNALRFNVINRFLLQHWTCIVQYELFIQFGRYISFSHYLMLGFASCDFCAAAATTTAKKSNEIHMIYGS